MRILTCRNLTVIALVALLTSVTSQESHAQVTSLYPGSVKSHTKQRQRSKRPPTYQLPDGWIEVPKDGLPKLGVSNRERVGISPVPTPIPRPVPYFYEPFVFPSLLDELIDMYTDAMLRGDLDSADLIEELIIIVSEY